MDAQDFLYRHGDKIAVSLVTALCVYGISSACTDPGIRPNLKAEDITARIEHVKDVSRTQVPPMLKDAPDHLGELHHRFTLAFQPRPVLANLTLHPDLGNAPNHAQGFYYIYELKPPTVVANDKVGLVEVVVTAPASVEHGDERITDKPEMSWTRSLSKDKDKDKADKCENHAAIVGYVIMEKSAGTDWHQIGEVTADNPTLQVKDVKAFETYDFRAVTIVKATGLGDTPDSSVIVCRGMFPLKPVPWETLNPKSDAVAAVLADPIKVPAFKVARNEQLFASEPSAMFEVQVGSDLKIALKKAGMALGTQPQTEGADPQPETAEVQLLVAKFERGHGWTDGKWLKPPEMFKVKPGDVVGDVRPVKLDESPRKVRVDFTTPFTLDRVERARERVVFWELKLHQRPGGGKDKDLVFEPKKANVDSVVLKNKQPPHSELVLLELSNIVRPMKAAALIFPDYPPGTFKEEEEFANHPDSFKQWGLLPPEPVKHQPGSGPLEELHKAGNDLAVTDTTYYELADGRLVYWDPVNHGVVVLNRNGNEAKPDDKDAKKPDESPAETGTEPAKEPAGK